MSADTKNQFSILKKLTSPDLGPSLQQDCAALPYNMSGIYGEDRLLSYYHVSLSSRKMAKLSGLILGCSTFEAGGSVDSND
jgi:hypothetical protein